MMPLTKLNYVLVDYENVQSLELERVAGLPVKVVLFVGQNQKYVPVELLRKACALSGCVEVVESVAAGKNAVDFQMACHAGRIAEREPGAFIHFVSRDKGFDAVVDFLKAGGRFSARAESFSSLLFLNPKDYLALPFPDRLALVLARLGKLLPIARPRKLSTLKTSIAAMFAKKLDESSIEQIVSTLQSENKVLVGVNGSLTYQIGPEPVVSGSPADKVNPQLPNS